MRRDTMTMSTRMSTVIISMVLVVAACGGTSDDDAEPGSDLLPGTAESETEQPVADDPDDSDATSAPAADDDGASEGSGPSTASVSLGGETYTFSTEGAVVAQCLVEFFGIFSVQLPLVDEGGAPGDGNVAIVALHEGTDPETVGEVDSVEVSVGDDTWIADEADEIVQQSDALEPGMSQVDSVEIDGRTVRGSATFVRQGSLFSGEVETMTGTFEATCGEERTA